MAISFKFSPEAVSILPLIGAKFSNQDRLNQGSHSQNKDYMDKEAEIQKWSCSLGEQINVPFSCIWASSPSKETTTKSRITWKDVFQIGSLYQRVRNKIKTASLNYIQCLKVMHFAFVNLKSRKCIQQFTLQFWISGRAELAKPSALGI